MTSCSNAHEQSIFNTTSPQNPPPSSLWPSQLRFCSVLFRALFADGSVTRRRYREVTITLCTPPGPARTRCPKQGAASLFPACITDDAPPLGQKVAACFRRHGPNLSRHASRSQDLVHFFSFLLHSVSCQTGPRRTVRVIPAKQGAVSTSRNCVQYHLEYKARS